MDVVEVTPLMRAAAGGLGVGELLQIPAFSLFEAMSAMEIGHEKMDPGLVGGGRGGDAAGARAAADDAERDLARALEGTTLGDGRQLLRVLDHLLAQEATHLSGGGLANTVYSSLFMMQIERLGEHPVLQAYCRGVQEMCLEAHFLVMQGCACEEEDFNVHLVGLPLEAAAAEMCGAPHAQRGRKATADCLAALTAAAAGALGKGKGKGRGKSSGGSPPAVAQALAERLLFRRDMLEALSAFRGKRQADLAAAATALGKVAGCIAAIRARSGLDAEGEEAAAAARVAGFVPTLNNHLTPPSPPRQLKVLSVEEAFDFYDRLAQELLRVTTIPAAIDSFPTLKQFIEDFAHAKPLALSRSALHLQLAPRSWEGGDQGPPPKWALSSDMLHAEMLGLPPPTPPPPGAGDDAAASPSPSVLPFPPHSADLETLLEQAVIAVGNWVQATLLNRARQRRRLRRGCEDMANLYQHALIAEACPLAAARMTTGGWRWRPLAADDPAGPLAIWVEKETAWHMCSHLLMGFELELVEASEVPVLFWYADFLLGTCARGLSALGAARPNPDRQQIYREQMQLDAMRSMCQGSFRLGLLLNACGAIAGGGGGGGGGASSSSLGCDAERFELRFGFFAAAVERPEPLSFEHFEAAADVSELPRERLVDLASESFARAKGVAELAVKSAGQLGLKDAQVAELKSLARTAGANVVAAGMVKRALAAAAVGDGDAPFALVASYDLKGGRAFPLVSLKSRKSW